MCLIITCVFSVLAYSFYIDGNMQGVAINGSIALLFFGLLLKNILKTKKDKKSTN
jgi:hypothetical protein